MEWNYYLKQHVFFSQILVKIGYGCFGIHRYVGDFQFTYRRF